MADRQGEHRDKPLAVALMGPTASGKTELAIALREKLNAELISVDSALVYRGMDIGTAKPTAEELQQAPHHLIDIRDPADPYSAADFCRDAKFAIDEILAAGKTPLLVGGTMLYFKALLEGLSAMPAADEKVRAEIEAEAEVHGWPHMHSQLAAVDSEAAARIHPNHSQRICRALEVYRISGQPMSAWQSESGEGLGERFDWRCLAIAPRNRAILHQRIAQRFEKMLAEGFVEEVKTLMARGDLHKDLPALRAVGYRQVWEYLEGGYDYPTMIAKGIAATRQLAKRQFTWLRSWPKLMWLYTQSESEQPLPFDEILNKALHFCR